MARTAEAIMSKEGNPPKHVKVQTLQSNKKASSRVNKKLIQKQIIEPYTKHILLKIKKLFTIQKMSGGKQYAQFQEPKISKPQWFGPLKVDQDDGSALKTQEVSQR